MGALAEDDSDVTGVAPPVAVRDVAVRDDAAAGRHQNPRQHFEGGGFSRAVRADIADHLALLDRKAHAVHGADRDVLADEKVLDGPQDSFAPLEGAEFLREVADFDEGRHISRAVKRAAGRNRRKGDSSRWIPPRGPRTAR